MRARYAARVAGRDHHFIPQLLQKGFSAGQTKKKKHQVWVFRRGQEPFRTGTLNSFVERDFYGPPSAAPVDQLITDEETKLDKFVPDARASAATGSLSEEELPVDLVLQISIRVRWIREFMVAGIQKMIDRTQSTFADKAALGAGYQKQFEKDPAWLHEELIKQAEKLRGRPLNAAEKELVATIEAQLRANPQKLTEFAPALPPLEGFQDGMKKATEQGHLQGLESALRARATKYREFLSRMRWSVIVFTEPTLILGDCGPLFQDAAGSVLGPIGVAKHEDVGGVALPISSTHALVGKLDAGCADPTALALNAGSAAWSSEAFIASAHTAENRRLHALINSKVGLYLESQIAEAFEESCLG